MPSSLIGAAPCRGVLTGATPLRTVLAGAALFPAVLAGAAGAGTRLGSEVASTYVLPRPFRR
jgi:hypothetical protein